MAKMLHEGLFVGNAADTYKFSGSILHAARDPWFLTAAQVLIKHAMDEIAVKRFFPVDNVIRMDYNQMALNMVDANDARYFLNEMVNAGLEFISERMAEGDPILVHCNAGLSRSPSLCFLWMFEHGFLDNEYQYAVPQFKGIYKDWCPGNGIWNYLKNRCENAG